MDKSGHDLIEKGLRGDTLTSLVDGWSFRVEEVSANVYKIEGTDMMGHKISNYGTNPDEVLGKSVKYANRILSRVEFVNKIKAEITKILKL